MEEIILGMICLECGHKLKNRYGIAIHTTKIHKMSMVTYNQKFNIFKYCQDCQIIIYNDKVNLCESCKEERTRLKRIAKNKLQWSNAEYRKKMCRPRGDVFCAEQSARITKWYIDNPGQKIIRSKSMKSSWQEGIIITNNINHTGNRSKIEKKLKATVENICYELITTDAIRLDNGKYVFPDMVIEELKLVIEFYGDYWHANPDHYCSTDMVNGKMAKDIWENDKARTQMIKDADYRVVEIWEEEWRHDPKMVLSNLDALINWESCSF